jgi:hypothetical protein
MVAIGILMFLGGGLVAALGFLMPESQLPPDQVEKLHQLETQLHASLATVCITAGCVFAVAGVYHMVMGLLVRKGRRGPIYTAVVTSFLVIGWCVVNSISSVNFAGASAAPGVCLLVIIGAVFVWLLLWLFQALRGSSSSAAAAQYQAQYWQMLQQQQAYGQQQGMAIPPPPTGVLAPPPPPQPPSPEPSGWAYGSQSPPPPPPAAAGTT